mgnify:CR=1 FL=1
MKSVISVKFRLIMSSSHNLTAYIFFLATSMWIKSLLLIDALTIYVSHFHTISKTQTDFVIITLYAFRKWINTIWKYLFFSLYFFISRLSRKIASIVDLCGIKPYYSFKTIAAYLNLCSTTLSHSFMSSFRSLCGRQKGEQYGTLYHYY